MPENEEMGEESVETPDATVPETEVVRVNVVQKIQSLLPLIDTTVLSGDEENVKVLRARIELLRVNIF